MRWCNVTSYMLPTSSILLCETFNVPIFCRDLNILWGNTDMLLWLRLSSSKFWNIVTFIFKYKAARLSNCIGLVPQAWKYSQSSLSCYGWGWELADISKNSNFLFFQWYYFEEKGAQAVSIPPDFRFSEIMDMYGKWDLEQQRKVLKEETLIFLI